MIKHLGHHYKVVINVKMDVDVIAHNEDDAIDAAFDEVEGTLEDCPSPVNITRSWYDIVERGEEALDITEDE